MLSKSAKYAIRAVEFLVQNSNQENKFRAQEIAEAIEVPVPFLAKILQALSRNKIISSTKGPHGGFFIKTEECKHSLWDVVVCIDGKAKFEECFLGTPNCDQNNPCSMHDIAVEFRNNLINNLKSEKIHAFKEPNKESKLKPKT